MTRVLLLTTGLCENLALAKALHRIFPDVCFHVTPRPLNGFTSSSLPERVVLPSGDSNLMLLAREMVAAVQPGQRGDPYDLVLVIEDLELANQAHPHRVTDHFREAVRAHLENHPWSSQRSQNLAIERVQTRCSFHLFAPMVETYFFGEPAALIRAGAQRPALLESHDLENFLVTLDREYLLAVDQSWARVDRVQHPKCYLQYLCTPNRYRESQGGVRALEKLDFETVLMPQDHMRFLRSLLVDLADGLGCPPMAGTLHELTQLRLGCRSRVLRNL